MPSLSRLTRVLICLLGASFALASGASMRGTPVTASGIGVNLASLGGGGPVAFVDAMKEAAPWTSPGHPTFDSLGNVVALSGAYAQTVIYPRGAYSAGDYTLLYDGAGVFDVSSLSGMVLSRAPGRLVIRVAPRPGYGIRLRLLATDPRNYPRNIRLIRPGFLMSYGISPFDPGFVNTLRGLSAIRFAGWQRPEPVTHRLWTARTVAGAFTQADAGGVAAEYMIALANAAQVNPWFTLPVDATDDYVARFSLLVARTLDPRLHATFEFGNEVWRAGSVNNAYASLAGRRIALAPDAATAALAWYSLRSVQVFAIADRAFVATTERPTHVLSGPVARSTVDGAPEVGAILKYANAGAHADALAVSADLVDTVAPNDLGLANSPGTTFSRSAALAGAARLRLISYQGGSAGQITPKLLADWRASGGGLFVVDALSAASPRTASSALQGAAVASRMALTAPPVAPSSSVASAPLAVGVPLSAAATPGTTLLTESFADPQTGWRAWTSAGASCLTAGTATTSVASIPACNGSAKHAAPGDGALQLATTSSQRPFVVFRTPLTTSRGLDATFTAYPVEDAPASGEVTFFLADAGQLMPTAVGRTSVAPAGTYVSVDIPTPGTLAASSDAAGSLVVRGSGATGNRNLGGSRDTLGRVARLPSSVDATAARSKLEAPTFRVIVTPRGGLTVALDRHDGNGFVAYESRQIAGQLGQSSLPESVYLGFTAKAGSASSRPQIGNLRVATLTPATTFEPYSVRGLVGWYDASNAPSLTKTAAGAVSAWHDSTGYADTLSVPAKHSPPTYVASGISGLGSVNFDGTTLLSGVDSSFSTNLFNESTVFVVGNETPTQQSGDLIFSGAYHTTSPIWQLSPTGIGAYSAFAFNTGSGALTAPKIESGPTIWTAGGTVAGGSQLLRRNGTTIASGGAPNLVASGSYPLSVGAMYSGGTLAAYGYRGQIGEIVLYHRFLTTAESAEVEGYLACKWGLQSRLPANHPYRSTCPGGSAPAPTPTPTATGAPLPDPVQLRSQSGQLTVNITATSDPVTHDPALSYNGALTPPTLRLSPGDTLIVNLTNRLPVPPAGSTYANDVNLHYHGLHVSPNAPADDSIDVVAAPGKTVQYKVPIPTDHPPGLYWYHSHAHAESERQNLAGMSGAIIIEGIAKYTPTVANMPERILIVRDRQPTGSALPPGDLTQLEAMRWGMRRAAAGHQATMMSSTSMSDMSASAEVRGTTNADTRNPYVDTNPLFRDFVRPQVADTHCQGDETAPKVWTVNGVTRPSIGIRPGEQQFWRLVNAGSDTYLDLQVDRANIRIIALDGVPLISGTNTPNSMTVSHYVVPPASRIEFIATGPAAGTAAYLRTNCFDAGPTGLAMPAAILASLDPSTSASAASRHTQRVSTKAIPFRFHTAAYIKAHAASVTQTVYFSEQLQMNGQSYNPSAPPMFYAQVGTTQDWTIVNTSTQVHTFHMHQIHFIVEAINGVNQAHQFVMDNVNIPPATTSGPGTVKVRLDFTDPLIVGTFLVHCHILSHEDAGMMAKIRVGTAPPLSANPGALTFASPAAAHQAVTIVGGKAPYSPSGCSKVANASVSGSVVTVAPAGSGDCVLTIADTTGLLANITISITAAKSPIVLSSNAVAFASSAAGAQTIRISGGALPYTASGCAGTASSAVSGSTLTVAPRTVGTCTIVVSDAKNATASLSVIVNQPTQGSAADNLTFHHDALRTGWNQHETILNTANVASSDFAHLTSLTAPSGATGFGKIYGQPLYASNEATSDGKTHNLVLLATSTDQVYAFDDKTFALVWHRSFLNPPSVVAQSWADTGCYSPGPDVGITGTPVIDRGLDRLYAVVATKENGTFHLRIHAISLKNGAEAVNPTDITGTVALATGGTASVDPLWNLQRPALLESAGNIYVALGSHCDWKNAFVHGWMLAYSASSLQMTGNMLDTSNANDGTATFLGSIWMSGYGPAADAQGNVYFATGNGPYDGGINNLGMSVVKVAGTLSRANGNVSTFTPFDEAVDSQADADLGSGGVMLLPDQPGPHAHMLIAGGKCGAGHGGTPGCQKYILNRDNLGGRQANEAGSLWHGNTAGWMWGGPAYFADATGVSHIVYGGGNGWDPLDTYNLNPSPTSMSVQSSQSVVGCLVCDRGDPGGSLPVVSSNGTVANSAIVWAVKTPGQSGGTMSLYAFDALKMSSTLFAGAAGSWNVPPGASEIPAAFVSPLIANGKVYLPVDGSVAVFGLKSQTNAARPRLESAVVAPTEDQARTTIAAAGEHLIYGTVVAIDGNVLTVALRNGRAQRVDASPAIEAGRFSAPLFVGKTVSVTGSYESDGTLQAATISKLGRADASAPPDR